MRGAAGKMLASATLLTLSPSLFAAPQSGTTAVTTSPDGAAYWAVVTGSAVNVRSGPSAQSAYAFGKLKQGDLVRVLKEEYGWARVQTEGSAFVVHHDKIKKRGDLFRLPIHEHLAHRNFR